MAPGLPVAVPAPGMNAPRTGSGGVLEGGPCAHGRRRGRGLRGRPGRGAVRVPVPLPDYRSRRSPRRGGMGRARRGGSGGGGAERRGTRRGHW